MPKGKTPGGGNRALTSSRPRLFSRSSRQQCLGWNAKLPLHQARRDHASKASKPGPDVRSHHSWDRIARAESPRAAPRFGRDAFEIVTQRAALSAKSAEGLRPTEAVATLPPRRALTPRSKPSGRIARVLNVEKSARTETRDREATSHLRSLYCPRAGLWGGLTRRKTP